MERNIYKIGKELFITSDEEIKGGDWCYHPLLKWGSVIKSKYDEPNSTMKKIILTTDQELIKDGVQAIDDEFLEWFVKNPSCEYIEIENVYDKFLNSGKRSVSDFRKKYKIIIPKEESKQCELCKRYPRLEGTNKCESCYSVVRHVLEQDPRFKDTLLPDLRKKQETSSVGVGNQIFKIVLDEKWIPNKVSIIEADNNSVLNKQETLEEAAKSHAIYELENNYKPTKESFKLACKRNFIRGAKWQQEQDKNKYSEEDLISLLEFNYKKETNQLGTLRKDYSQKIVKEWFEQFKKK